MPPLPPGVTMEELLANPLAPKTNGFTDMEWKLGLGLFEQKLAATPEEERTKVMATDPDGTEWTPTKWTEEVRNKTELGTKLMNGLLQQLMIEDTLSRILGV